MKKRTTCSTRRPRELARVRADEGRFFLHYTDGTCAQVNQKQALAALESLTTKQKGQS